MSTFSSDEFVNREKELAYIKDKITRLARGDPFAPVERVVHFIGPSGIGKSRLLQESHRVVSQDLREKSISIRFDSLNTRSLREHLIEIDTTLFTNLGGPRVINNEESMLRINNSVLSRLDNHLGKKAFVLFVDEVDSLSVESRKDVELHLFTHLLRNARTFLVMAGRGVVKWSDFSLTSHPVNTFALSSFDVNTTRKQLELSTLLAEKIQELGGGVPGHNKKLARHIVGEPPNIQNELEAVRSLRADVINENKIEERFHSILDVICILQGFYPEDVVPLIKGHPSLGDQWDETKIKEVFFDLKQVQIGPGGLINWDREKKSWAVDKSTRDLFERELKMREPGLWRKLHCIAYQMYKQWGTDHNSQFYKDKAAYHEQCVQSAGMGCDDLEG